jgi:hypothetical protein
MQDENELNDKLTPGERELEMALGGLPLAAGTLDRDELMFQAGARSARRSVNVWRSAAVAMAACMALIVFVRRETEPRQIVRTEPVNIIGPRAPAATFAAERGPFTLASLNRLVMNRGVDALPADSEPDEKAGPSSIPSLLQNRGIEPATGDPL